MKYFAITGLFLMAQAPTIARAIDQVDVTAAEIKAVLEKPEVLQILRHKEDKPGNGIEKITAKDSRYSVYVRNACWITFAVKSHVDKSIDKVIIDSVSNYGGACD